MPELSEVPYWIRDHATRYAWRRQVLRVREGQDAACRLGKEIEEYRRLVDATVSSHVSMASSIDRFDRGTRYATSPGKVENNIREMQLDAGDGRTTLLLLERKTKQLRKWAAQDPSVRGFIRGVLLSGDLHLRELKSRYGSVQTSDDGRTISITHPQHVNNGSILHKRSCP